jgi:hypothetical protein
MTLALAGFNEPGDDAGAECQNAKDNKAAATTATGERQKS